ncbi:pyridoxal-phosphate-dependent aminotransferase family protein [Palleronia rufa]|uniref:pyridoxal-phosphate-dependent aminotransferase family protein n=1 Tax=Palleronia rufa TaxID=1530186 RepID=UPI00056D73CF|nr:aminotransferase class V-fold PLP-dependent enzyme [Palleronia rufa]
MSLAHGRPYLAIPGPSVMPDRVLAAMHRAAPNIYEGELVEITRSIVADLKTVARTTADCAIYIANGHGTWEAALANVLRPGDAVLVPATGRFAHGWAEVARAMGAEARIVEYGKAAPLDAERVADALAEDRDHTIRAVLGVHVDTSTGIRNDLSALRAALDHTGHPALLMADCIASMACDRFEMDALGVDVALTASQKGLMTPPGLGILWIGEKAQAARAELAAVSPYWDWRPRCRPEVYYQHFCGTAPTHHLFGLRAALDMLLDEGMEAVWSRHETLARAVWAAVEAWGADGPLRINAPPGHRSHAVTALSLGGDRAERLRGWCAAEGGVTLGIGLGMADPGGPDAGGFFRIGHMGHLNAHMVLGALGVIESGLTALDIPHGPGALQAAAAICAGK